MKQILYLAVVIGAAAFLAGCQPVTQSTSPTPTATSNVSKAVVADELTSIAADFDQISEDKDFPAFTEKDLQ